MANQQVTAEEVLLDVKVAEASTLFKFYLNQEKKILGSVAVILFVSLWEFVGGALSVYNPFLVLRVNLMFMSSLSLIAIAGCDLFFSGEFYNVLFGSGY